MELTYDEIWGRMAVAKALAETTGDTLARSAIPHLAKALQRFEHPDEAVRLTSVEEDIVNGLEVMEAAYFTLYGRRVS